MKRKIFFIPLIAAPFFFIGSTFSYATILSYEFNVEFSDASEPVGTPPWLTATVNDEIDGQVTLTLNSSGLEGVEHVKAWYFNLNPLLDAMTVAYPTDGSSNFTTDTTDAFWMQIGHANDFWKADGDNGLYDFVVNFTDAEGDGRLYKDELFSITFYSPTLSAYDFNFGNVGSTKGGPFYMAAHVGGIGPNGEDSGWIAATGSTPIPEPATMLLFGTGIVGLAAVTRRKRTV